MGSVHYDLTAESSDLVSEMKQAKAALYGVEKAGDKTTKAAKKLGGQSKKTTAFLNAFKNAAEGVGGKAGESAGKVEKFAQAAGGLSSALGPLGLAIGAAGVAIAAMGAAGVAAALQTTALVAELQKAGRTDVITKEQLAVVKAMDTEIERLKLDMKEAVAVIGSEFAPAVLAVAESARTAIVQLNEMRESTRWMFEGSATFRNAISGGLLGYLTSVKEETQAAVSEATKARGFLTGFAISTARPTAAAPSPRRGSGSADASLARKKNELAMAAALAELQRSEAHRLQTLMLLEEERYRKQTESAAAFAAQQEQQWAREDAANERAMQQARQLADTKRETQFAAASAIAGSIQQVAQVAVNADKDSTESAKKAALIAFRIAQAAGIAQIAINTASGITRAFSDLGPIAGIPAAAAVGATGTAATIVAAAQRPPQFDQGGMVAPDHRTISASPGEGVLTRQGVAALGGSEAVRATNQGRSGSGQQSITIQLGHRHYNAMASEHLDRGGVLDERIRESAGPRGQVVVGA